jgi:hypothetical protein
LATPGTNLGAITGGLNDLKKRLIIVIFVAFSCASRYKLTVSETLAIPDDKDTQIAALQAELVVAKADIAHRDLLIERKQQLNIRGMLRPATACTTGAAPPNAVWQIIREARP